MTYRIRAWHYNSQLYNNRALEAHSTENRIAYSNSLSLSFSTMSTTDRLNSLRGLFDKHGIDIYIVLTQDEHESEYTSDADNRREFISGKYFYSTRCVKFLINIRLHRISWYCRHR